MERLRVFTDLERSVARRYRIDEAAGAGMEVGDVLFTAGWLLRSRLDETTVAAVGLTVVGGGVRGLPAPMLGRQYAPPSADADGGTDGEAPHAGWAKAVLHQIKPREPMRKHASNPHYLDFGGRWPRDWL